MSYEILQLIQTRHGLIYLAPNTSDNPSNVPIFALDIATSTGLGGIKVGENLQILSDGTLTAPGTNQVGYIVGGNYLPGDIVFVNNLPYYASVAISGESSFNSSGNWISWPIGGGGGSATLARTKYTTPGVIDPNTDIASFSGNGTASDTAPTPYTLAASATDLKIVRFVKFGTLRVRLDIPKLINYQGPFDIGQGGTAGGSIAVQWFKDEGLWFPVSFA